MKALEAQGYTFEAADASFELLLREEADGGAPAVLRGRVLAGHHRVRARRSEAQSEATVKLRAGGERVVVTGEGNGPVNALDHALRTAIGALYPEIDKLELIDYKVRILDAAHGTDAVTRVLVETTDGKSSWETVGVAPTSSRRPGRRWSTGSPTGCSGRASHVAEATHSRTSVVQQPLAHRDEPPAQRGCPLREGSLAGDVLGPALRRLDRHRALAVGGQVVGRRLHVEEADSPRQREAVEREIGRHRRAELHRPLVTVHPGVQAARLLLLDLASPGWAAAGCGVTASGVKKRNASKWVQRIG